MRRVVAIAAVVLLSTFTFSLLYVLASMGKYLGSPPPRARRTAPSAATDFRDPLMARQEEMKKLMQHQEVFALTRLLRTLLFLSSQDKFPASDEQARQALPLLRHLVTAQKLRKETMSQMGNYFWAILTPSQRAFVPKEMPSLADIPAPDFDPQQPFRKGKIHRELQALVRRLEKRLKEKRGSQNS
ncbi:MAG: hypothetical protein NZT92_18105 [Abditibacteriales bacterium]|nr:hypothetical protein [Abditibacteriales bacterium]MDW8367727.1 hypothetical protein [Abditibacteriales bacterium]